MGKRITQQARGKGSLTYKVRRKGYRYKISYPKLNTEGKAKIIKLFNSAGHTSPLAKIEVNDTKQNKEVEKVKQVSKNKQEKPSEQESKQTSEKKNKQQSENSQTLEINNNKITEINTNKQTFIVPAAEGIYEGQEIYLGKRPENQKPEIGDILKLKEIAQGTKVFNIEIAPGKGGKILRSAGNSGIVGTNEKGKVEILIKRRRLKLNENCRAIIGTAAGEGRKMKPFVKAGRKYHLMKSKGRKWHRTSAVKVNAINHPFGGGRGKRIKSKIAKRNSSPGKKVGHIRPRKTGKRK